jgi:hypothetical protein
MNTAVPNTPNTPQRPADLAALLAVISDGIEALVAWDVKAFQAAVERQSAICDRIAAYPTLPPNPDEVATIRKVRELNRIYGRLLKHSNHWTHTLRTILQIGGHMSSDRATVHFRG